MATGNITRLEGVWPETHERAVRDSAGVTLETKLGNINTNISQLDQKIAEELGPDLVVVSTTEGIKSNTFINTDGYVDGQNNFLTTAAYSVIGATKVNFKGWIGSTYHSWAFYDSLGKYLSGNTLPSSSSLDEEELAIPSGAASVVFAMATSKLSDFAVSIKYDNIGVDRRLAALESQAKLVDDSFEKATASKSYGELFTGTPLSASSYYFVLLTPIFGKVDNVQVTCDAGATVTVFKYKRDTSSLTQLGAATNSTQDQADVTVDCNDAPFNGEMVAVGTTSKLAYRNSTGAMLFGSTKKTGAYRNDSTFDFSFKVNMAEASIFSAPTLSEIDRDSNLPLNSRAVFDVNRAVKVAWSEGVMTSVGTIYNDNTKVHSEYIKANSYFAKQVVNFNSSIYAWYFFDKRFYPIGGYKPASTGNVTINGKLPNIPANAEYVVLNQSVSTFVDLYALPLDGIASRWAGKNVLFIGDSFIAEGYLPTQICNLLGCNAINRGVSGSIVASKGGSSYQSLVDRLDGYNDDESADEKYHSFPETCDAVIINCSINDYGTNTPMGTMTAGYSVKTTFYGGVHYVINKLVEKYGNIPILWINATHRNSVNLPEFVINQDGTFTITKNNAECSLKDYVLALEEVCNAYSIPVVDVYRYSRFQPLFAENKSAYTSSGDGLHPNAAGAKLLALRVLENIAYIGY